MVNDQDNQEGGEKQDKFDVFSREGEAAGYISLDQARVLGMRTASETPGAYGRSFRDVPMAFDVIAEEETEDHYVITLSFRPQGAFAGTPGQEQFFIEKEGTVAHRQVLSLPITEEGARRLPVVPVAIGLVVVVIAAVVGFFVFARTPSEERPAPVAAPAPTGKTPAPIAAPAPLPEVATALPRMTATAVPAPARPVSRDSGFIQVENIWRRPVPGGTQKFAFGPQGTDNLYAVNNDGLIIHFDGTGGDERWRLDLGPEIRSVVTGRDLLYVAIGADVLGIDPDSGEIRTKTSLGSEALLATGPAGHLYAVSIDGTLFALPLGGGPPRWSIVIGDAIKAAPAVDTDGTVYVGTVEPGSHPIGPVEVSPTLLGSIYVGASGVLFAFDRNGDNRWKNGIEGPAKAPPIVAGDYGNVYALSEIGLFGFANDGALLDDIGMPDAIALAMGPNGTPFVLLEDGNLLAVDPRDGRAVGVSGVPGSRWLTAGPEGILYVGGMEGVAALNIGDIGRAVPIEAQPVVFQLDWVSIKSLDDPFLGLEQAVAAEINPATDNRVRTEFGVAEELGIPSADLPVLVADGKVALTTVSLRDIARLFPLAEAVDLAGLYRDIDTARKAAELFRPHLEEILMKEFNIRLLTLWPADPQVTYCRSDGGDWVGVFSAAHADFVAATGGQALSLDPGAAFGALERGDIDCVIGGAIRGNRLGWHNVTSDLGDYAFTWDFHAHLMHQPLWEEILGTLDQASLERLKATFLNIESRLWELSPEASQRAIACSTGDDLGCRGSGELGGMTRLQKLGEDDFLELRRLVEQEIIPRWVERCGQNCADIFNESISQVVGVKAGFEPITVELLPAPAPAPTPASAFVPTPVPPPAPPQARILFESDRDGNSEIYVMNADGSDPTNLTNDPASDWGPVWSPGGHWIAFTSDRGGNDDVYIMEPDGSNPVNLTNNPAFDWGPTRSHDGGMIAFASDRDGNFEIYVMNRDGSNLINISNNPANDWYASWSPSGERIAFASDRFGADVNIFTMNPDGSGVARLTEGPAFDGKPSWSPDGGRIAFYTDRDGNEEIYSMNADGSGLIRLTNHVGSDVYPSWSSDGSRIAFASDRDGCCDIFLMDPDGSGVVNLTNSPSFDWGPSWEP